MPLKDKWNKFVGNYEWEPSIDLAAHVNAFLSLAENIFSCHKHLYTNEEAIKEAFIRYSWALYDGHMGLPITINSEFLWLWHLHKLFGDEYKKIAGIKPNNKDYLCSSKEIIAKSEIYEEPELSEKEIEERKKIQINVQQTTKNIEYFIVEMALYQEEFFNTIKNYFESPPKRDTINEWVEQFKKIMGKNNKMYGTIPFVPQYDIAATSGASTKLVVIPPEVDIVWRVHLNFPQKVAEDQMTFYKRYNTCYPASMHHHAFEALTRWSQSEKKNPSNNPNKSSAYNKHPPPYPGQYETTFLGNFPN